MTGILDDFLNGIDDDWQMEDVCSDEAPKKKGSLPTITWLRMWLRKHGPTPRHEVLAAGKRAGYRDDLIEGAAFRNRCIITAGQLWSVRPNSVEFLTNYLLENGETESSVAIAAGKEAGFKESTILAARTDMLGFKMRKDETGKILWSIQR